ncbi:MAG: YceD family protein [Candidatus Binatia bacterium]
MRIRVEEIKESNRSITFPEDVGEVNDLLSLSNSVDYRFTGAAEVSVKYYRSGEDLFFEGRLVSPVSGTCARCLESYPFEIDRGFTFVLKPAREATTAEPSLSEEDLALSFYSGEEVDLSPLLREEMLLSLPTRPLCREDCSGLCPRCGKNRNTAPCACSEERLDPRLAPLRDLKLRSR